MAKATNGKTVRPYTENGIQHWVTLIDQNDKFIERQVYIDDDGIDYISLGGFFFDRLVIEETFKMRILPYEKNWNGIAFI